MNHIRIVFLSALSLVCSSCSSQSDVPSSIHKCVEDKTSEVLKTIYGEGSELGLYEILLLAEKELKKEGLLESITKGDYRILLKAVYSTPDTFLKNEIIREYSSISGLVITPVTVNCPYEVVVKESHELESSIVNQFNYSSLLQADGYDKRTVEDYLDGIREDDFTDIEYRAPLIIILLYQLNSSSH